MKTNAARCAAVLAMVAFAAPFPAAGQYFPPILLIVPPAAQHYAAPKPQPDRPKPDYTKPYDASLPDGAKGHYQGRTFIPDLQ